MGTSAPDNVRRLPGRFYRCRIERQIPATDTGTETFRCAQGDPAGRIDALVYELYGLTEVEIRVVLGELR